MNIYEKLLSITTELNTVAKNLTVQQTKTSSYKAVSERDILDAVKPLEAKYKVYSFPVSRRILESNLLETESTYNGNTTKKTTFMTRIETVYRFVNIEEPTEFIETTVFSEGIDSQDKGSGKAMTYGDKYALMKAYKISTGDDPDQQRSEEENYKAKQTFDNLLSPNQKKIIDGYPGVTKKWIADNYGEIDKLTREQATSIITAVSKKQEEKS